MAEDTVDVLVRRDGRRASSTTASTPLPAPSGIEELRAHVVHAVREEQCVRLTDFMIARRALALLDRDHGLAAVDEVAAVMASELGWTSEQTGREIETYRGRVAAETAFLREL
ncbi:MAG TPA: glycerol-3-phosphate dehydrogenase C-terminal domain-containing protein [bacterium]|nr:glycerol-3-phosphate dehydrogenase C-terminal domain-containing protein [bacterium]